MKQRYIMFIAVVVAIVLFVGAVGLSQAQGSGTMATAFVLQNLGNSQANVVVDFRNTGGTLTRSYTGITIPVGSAVNLDQRYTSGDPGTSPFQGSVIASSDQPLGSVVNLMRTGGTVNSYESYNGLGSSAVGKSVRVLQVLKAVASGGQVYNTSISIQNTDVSNSTNVTVTFVPDPILNPAVGGTLTNPVSKVYNVAAGATQVIDQAIQTDPNIGTKFFGSARIESSSADVGVVTLSDGGGQVLLAQPAYSAGTTQPIALPSVYKYISSLGDSYSTAFLIANMGTQTATVQIQYFPASASYTVSGSDTVVIPPGSVKNVDQRTDAPSITSATFMGAALVTPITTTQTGVREPVQVMCNLRGGTRYAMTYGGITGGATTGNKIYLPVGYKYINSAGYSWSSTIVFYSFVPTSQVRVSFYDNRSGVGSWTSAVYDVAAGTQFDLRNHASTAGHADFFGAAVVEVVSGQVGAIVQTRGAGGTGDALMAYLGLSQ